MQIFYQKLVKFCQCYVIKHVLAKFCTVFVQCFTCKGLSRYENKRSYS